MAKNELQSAADSLQQAAEAAQKNDARERLREQSDQFSALADAASGPDHGKLARHEYILTEIADEAPDAADHIETALESIRAYRETIEGV